MKNLFFAFLIFPLFINAQVCHNDGASKTETVNVNNQIDSLEPQAYGSSNLSITSTKFKNTSIKGNPFAFKDWKKGQISTSDQSDIAYNKIQIDFEKGQVLIENEQSKIATVIPSEQIVFIEVNEDNIKRFFTIIESSEFKEDIVSNLFEVYSNEHKYLVKETSKKLYKSNDPDKSNQMIYKTKSQYYVKDRSGKYVQTKLNKKHLLKILKDKEKDVKKYIDENNLTYNVEDVLKILSYYHSLAS